MLPQACNARAVLCSTSCMTSPPHKLCKCAFLSFLLFPLHKVRHDYACVCKHLAIGRVNCTQCARRTKCAHNYAQLHTSHSRRQHSVPSISLKSDGLAQINKLSDPSPFVPSLALLRHWFGPVLLPFWREDGGRTDLHLVFPREMLFPPPMFFQPAELARCKNKY